MKDLEREHILQVLKVRRFAQETRGQLGISERTLRYKLQQYARAVLPVDTSMCLAGTCPMI